MNFKEYLDEQLVSDLSAEINTLLFLSEHLDELNEDDFLAESNKFLQKLGLDSHKTKSILGYIKTFTSGVGKVMLYMLKGNTEKAKELVNTLNKEDVVDFILKLDAGTLHILTVPLHTIEAWTGWHISPMIAKKIKSGKTTLDNIKSALTVVKDGIGVLFSGDPKRRVRAVKIVDNISKEILV